MFLAGAPVGAEPAGGGAGDGEKRLLCIAALLRRFRAATIKWELCINPASREGAGGKGGGQAVRLGLSCVQARPWGRCCT